MALESVKQNISANAASSGQVTNPWIRKEGVGRAGWAGIFNAKNSQPSDLPEDATREFSLD